MFLRAGNAALLYLALPSFEIGALLRCKRCPSSDHGILLAVGRSGRLNGDDDDKNRDRQAGRQAVQHHAEYMARMIC